MGKVLIIVRHEFAQAVRRRMFVIATISVPLLATVGMLVHQIVQDYGRDPEAGSPGQIGYVDATARFSGFTERAQDLTFRRYSTESEARNDLLDGQIDEYFVIPGDYLESGNVVR